MNETTLYSIDYLPNELYEVHRQCFAAAHFNMVEINSAVYHCCSLACEDIFGEHKCQ